MPTAAARAVGRVGQQLRVAAAACNRRRIINVVGDDVAEDKGNRKENTDAGAMQRCVQQ